MSADVIPFPGPEDDIQEILINAHIALMEAVQHNQSPDQQVTVTLELEEALQLIQLIERSVDPEWFEDDDISS